MHGTVEVEAKVFVTGKKKKNPHSLLSIQKLNMTYKNTTKKIRKNKDPDRK
jgi:hypothetical protein